MNRSSLTVVGILLISLVPAVAQSQGPPGESSLPPGEVPDGSVSGQPQRITSQEYVVPEELKAEADKAVARFMQLRDKLEQSLGDQRDTHVRYMNGLDRTPAAQERYRQQRDESRRLIDETYIAAMNVFQYQPDPLAGQYIMTVIEHRGERDIYGTKK